MTDNQTYVKVSRYYLYIYTLIDSVMYDDENKCTESILSFLKEIESDNLYLLKEYILYHKYVDFSFNSNPDEFEKKNKALINLIDQVINDNTSSRKR